MTRHNTLPKLLIVLDPLIIKKINNNANPTRARITSTKVIIYITSTPFLLNQRSTTPHIKKAKDNTLAPRPVKAVIFGPKLLKQQNKASIPIFYLNFI